MRHASRQAYIFDSVKKVCAWLTWHRRAWQEWTVPGHGVVGDGLGFARWSGWTGACLAGLTGHGWHRGKGRVRCVWGRASCAVGRARVRAGTGVGGRRAGAYVRVWGCVRVPAGACAGPPARGPGPWAGVATDQYVAAFWIFFGRFFFRKSRFFDFASSTPRRGVLFPVANGAEACRSETRPCCRGYSLPTCSQQPTASDSPPSEPSSRKNHAHLMARLFRCRSCCQWFTQ